MGLGAGIRDPGFGVRKKPLPDPGACVKKAPDPGSKRHRIPDPYPQHEIFFCFQFYLISDPLFTSFLFFLGKSQDESEQPPKKKQKTMDSFMAKK